MTKFYKRGYFKPVYKYGARRYSKNGAFSATKLLKDVKMLKDAINVEKKFIDTNSAGVAISTTPNLTLINGITQGGNLTERIGDSVKMVNLQIEGYVSLNASANFDYIRLVYILDRQANSAAPTYANVYETNDPYALRNKLAVDRFQVLKEFKLDLNTNGETVHKISHFLKFRNGKDAHIKFNGTGNTIASIYTNSIYLMVVGVQPTNTSVLQLNTRIRFVDN